MDTDALFPVYLPAAKKLVWSTVTSEMSTARSGCAAVALDRERILVLGGSSGYWSSLDTMEVFHLSTQTWTSPLSSDLRMGYPRYSFAAVALPSVTGGATNNICVMGGHNSSGVLANTEMLDFETQQCVELSSMNVRRQGCAAVLISPNLILVVGGHDGTSTLDTAEIYNTDHNQWTLLPSKLSTPRSQCAAAIIDQRVYVMGGTNIFEPLDSCEILDLTTQQWSSGPTMHHPRQGLTSVAVGNHIFAIGGSLSYYCPAPVEMLDPATGVWTMVKANMSVNRYQAAAVSMMGHELYVVGGESRVSRHKTMERMALQFLPDTPILPSQPLLPGKSGQQDAIGKEDYVVQLSKWIKDVTIKKNVYLWQLQDVHSKVSEEHAKKEEALQCKMWEQEQELETAILKHQERMATIQRDLDKYRDLHEEALVRIESTKESWLTKIDKELVEAKDIANNGESGDQLVCPITRQLMVDPVLAMDGFSYERDAIAALFVASQQQLCCSPVTGETLTSDTLIPNLALRDLCRRHLLVEDSQFHVEVAGQPARRAGDTLEHASDAEQHQSKVAETLQADEEEQVDSICTVS